MHEGSRPHDCIQAVEADTQHVAEHCPWLDPDGLPEGLHGWAPAGTEEVPHECLTAAMKMADDLIV